MAYDQHLAARIREILGDRDGLTAKEMFGGICFMLHGNMCCGVVNDDLMVRLGPELGEEALHEPYARPMDFTGRPMKGFVYVSPDGTATEPALRAWVARVVAFASTLPPR